MLSSRAVADRCEARRDRVRIGLIVLSFTAWASSSLSTSYRFCAFNHDDGGIYLALGGGIAAGLGYTASLDPSAYVAHTHFPPGLPLLLAVSWLVRSGSPLLHQCLMLAIAVLALWAVWRVTRLFAGRAAAAVVICLTAFSPITVELATAIMAEHLALFLSMLGLWGLHMWTANGRALDRWAGLAVVTIGYGVLTKGTVLALVPAYAVYTWLETAGAATGPTSRRRALVLLIACVVPFVWWTVRGAITPAAGFHGLSQVREYLAADVSGEGVASAGELAGLLSLNVLWNLPLRLADCVFGAGWLVDSRLGCDWAVVARVVILMAAAVIIGWGLRQRSGLRLVALTWLFLAAMLLTRHNGGAERYWVTASPLLAILVAARLGRGGAEQARGRGRLLANLPWIAMLIGLSVLAAERALGPRDPPAWDDLVSVARSASYLTEDDAVILSHNPSDVRLIAGRPRRPAATVRRELRAGTATDPLYLLAPKPEAVAQHGRDTLPLGEGDTVAFDDVPGSRQLILESDYYRLFRLGAGSRRLPAPAE